MIAKGINFSNFDFATVPLSWQISFTRSNTSLAFPYVSASQDENLENLLVSGFAEACGDDLGISNVAFVGSCSMDDKSRVKNAALHSVQVINKIMWHDPLWNFGSCNVILMLFVAHYNLTGIFDQEDGRESWRENRFGCVLPWRLSTFEYCWQDTIWRYICWKVMGLIDMILPSAKWLYAVYICRWSFIWAYQLCRGIRGKICSSLCVRSLQINPVSFLQGTA